MLASFSSPLRGHSLPKLRTCTHRRVQVTRGVRKLRQTKLRYATTPERPTWNAAPGSVPLASEIKQLNVKGKYKEAIAIWQNAKKSGDRPDIFAYTAILAVYRAANDIEGAREVVQDVEKANLHTEILDNQIFDFYSRIGELEKAKKVLDTLPSYGFSPYGYALMAFARRTALNGDVNGAVGIMEEYKELPHFLDKMLLNAVLTAALKNQDSLRANRLLALMDYAKVEPDPMMYNSILFLYARTNDEVNLQRTISEMRNKKNGVSSIPAYTALMQFYGSRTDIPNLVKIWAEVNERGITHTASMYGQLITTFVNAGRTAEAVKYYQHMIARHVEPTAWIKSTLVRGYATDGDLVNANKLYQEVLSEGAPTMTVFFPVLELFGLMGESGQLDKVLQDMAKFHLQPIASTFVIIFRMLYDYNFYDQLPVRMEQLEKSGITPNIAIHKFIIQLELQNQQVDKAERYFKSIEASLPPHMHPILRSLFQRASDRKQAFVAPHVELPEVVVEKTKAVRTGFVAEKGRKKKEETVVAEEIPVVETKPKRGKKKAEETVVEEVEKPVAEKPKRGKKKEEEPVVEVQAEEPKKRGRKKKE